MYTKRITTLGKVVPLWGAVSIIISKILEENNAKIIQEAISKQKSIKIDNIFGQQSFNTLIQCDPNQLLQDLGKLWVEYNSDAHPEKVVNAQEKIRSYILEAEGTKVHWNKTESNFTTPGGVYAKLFPHSKPVKYVRQLAKKYRVDLSRRNLHQLHKLNNSMTREEFNHLTDLVVDFELAHFADNRVVNLLDPNEGLVYFSLALNGGLSRGNKAVQSAIKVKVDGKIGKGTLKVLEIKKDQKIVVGMLNYMQYFYDYLIHKNPRKYGLYKRGWHNRLVALAKKTHTIWK